MEKGLQFKRYPNTSNTSLQAWSAADEYMLDQIKELKLNEKKVAVFNDRFGYLACNLANSEITTVISFKSQEKALHLNSELNSIPFDTFYINNPLSPFKTRFDLSLIKIPKSLALFELYLQHVATGLKKDGTVLCGFMTRHFNKNMLEIAEKYFGSSQQSKAWKKSRVLILKDPKPIEFSPQIKTIAFEHPSTGEAIIQQYPGVFSSSRIDTASQFLLDHMSLSGNEIRIMDLASGSGILGLAALKLNIQSEIHLVDDSWLAIESSKLNLDSERTHFHYSDTLTSFDNEIFDLVISNPPFHFEYETNIEVSLSLFRQVHDILRSKGIFTLVANKHLNYKTHLTPLFSEVTILAENNKFVIYQCTK